jgi:hypothetical protein
MVERWKEIPGYNGLYEVSDHGQVRSYAHTGRKPKSGIVKRRDIPIILRPTRSKKIDGYVQVDLQCDGERKIGRMHRLVAEAFIGEAPFEGALVMHKDDDKTNNHYSNLAWGTTADNVDDKVSKSRHPMGTKMYNAKLTDLDIPLVRGLFNAGWTLSEVGRMFEVSAATIKDIITGRTWKHVTGVEGP